VSIPQKRCTHMTTRARSADHPGVLELSAPMNALSPTSDTYNVDLVHPPSNLLRLVKVEPQTAMIDRSTRCRVAHTSAWTRHSRWMLSAVTPPRPGRCTLTVRPRSRRLVASDRPTRTCTGRHPAPQFFTGEPRPQPRSGRRCPEDRRRGRPHLGAGRAGLGARPGETTRWCSPA
jgi:hypothetical protein